ncbi:hypothetical protein Pdw03_5895 [Penicillium digitatum]|uniref:Uncharacterized protein n=1 Tax=Penicillium digitatum TaxID=36651 RepID=A0A7T7BQC9_PENDI|nr:hypothetical protein Pdw03_5895 [Penicillium digitatum]
MKQDLDQKRLLAFGHDQLISFCRCKVSLPFHNYVPTYNSDTPLHRLTLKGLLDNLKAVSLNRGVHYGYTKPTSLTALLEHHKSLFIFDF